MTEISGALGLLIKHAGSQANLARDLNVSKQAVHFWVRRGAIPEGRVLSIASRYKLSIPLVEKLARARAPTRERHDMILPAIESFLRRHKMAPHAFGTRACRDKDFVVHLRRGRILRASTRERVLKFMEEYE